MVKAVSKKTGLIHEFTEDQWQGAESNGLAKKFNVLSKVDEKTVIRFTPPELETSKELGEKPEDERKPKRKRST